MCLSLCLPGFKDEEIQLYYGASDWLHFGWRNGSLALATLRRDGFAGYMQLEEGSIGSIVTKSIPYQGEGISLTADVEDGGSIAVSVITDEGEIIEAAALRNTVTDAGLDFDSKVKKGNIQLIIEISKAKVYAFYLQ